MRNLLRTALSVSGKVINIYKVEGLTFDPKKLGVDWMYKIRYVLGNSEEEIESIYLYNTDDYRTIVFRSPHNMTGTIGIPARNIISISHIGK